MKNDEGALLTAEEAMELLRISRSTLARLVQSGCITGFRVGSQGNLRFKRGDIDGALRPLAPAMRLSMKLG